MIRLFDIFIHWRTPLACAVRFTFLLAAIELAHRHKPATSATSQITLLHLIASIKPINESMPNERLQTIAILCQVTSVIVHSSSEIDLNRLDRCWSLLVVLVLLGCWCCWRHQLFLIGLQQETLSWRCLFDGGLYLFCHCQPN